MLKSMTAYSYVEQNDGDMTARAEIRTYNSRHLDVVLRLPTGYAGFEDKIKALVGQVMVRGRVEVRLGIKDDSEQACAYEVDLVRAKAYLDAVMQLNDSLDTTSGPLPIEHLASVSGVIVPAEVSTDIDVHWPLTDVTIKEALENVKQMRIKEGAFLQQDFVQRLNIIESKLSEIEDSVQGLLDRYREKLQARVEALTKGLVEIDPSRITQEAGILADRSDISEEIVRARSHIQQFRNIMESDEPAGRKLNFLLQEFNREFNTMGAKVGQADAAHVIVDIKSEIEKLREQVQNIE
jgi:uncharacterized protein (TIGR00255 family)